MSDADRALVLQAQSGDRAAFEELVRRTSRLVFARLYLETGDTHRAEDLLQDTYLSAFRSLHRLKSPDGFRPWLLAIAHNAMTDAARRDGRKKRAGPTSETPLGLIASSALPPDEVAQRDETRQAILAVLRSLPDDHRLPLTLRYIVGADYETISTQLGLSNGALRGMLHRGLKLLRDRLPDHLKPNHAAG